MNDSTLVAEYLDADNGQAMLVLAPPQHADPTEEFACAVADGLRRRPRRLDSRFLYDASGSALFEKICGTPEYYPTRTEAAILLKHAPEIAKITGPVCLSELGSGTSVKTIHILEAYLDTLGPPRYVPIDVSRAALEEAQQNIADELPAVEMKPIHGSYEHAFEVANVLSPVMMIFLGSSIGNFSETQSMAFWTRVSGSLNPGDFFLLGVDLVKDVATLEAAYNDEAGYTAAFTRNLFARMNRELGARLDVDAIEHVALYNRERDRIETYARFARAQRLHVEPVGATFDIDTGEGIRVEISRKFRLEDLEPQLAGHGFTTRRVFTDARKWFALLLLERTAT